MSTTFDLYNKSAHLNLSGSDLIVTGTGFYQTTAKTTTYKNSGKWYCEFKLLSYTTGGPEVGIANSSAPLENFLGVDVNGYSYYNNAPSKQHAGGAVYGTAWGAGDIISVVWNADSGTLSFWKNGVDQGVAFTGITGSWCFAVGMYGISSFQAYFAPAGWTYTPPVGYLGIDEIAPSPTIGNGSPSFEALTAYGARIAAGAASTLYMTAAGGYNGIGAASLLPFTISGNGGPSIGAVTLLPLTATGIGTSAASGRVTLEALTVSATGHTIPDWQFSAALSPLTASFTAKQGNNAALAASVPAVTAAFSGGRYFLDAALPALSASFSALSSTVGRISSRVPAPTASFTASVTQLLRLDATLPVIQFRSTALSGGVGRLAAQVPSFTSSFDAVIGVKSTLSASFPALSASLAAYSRLTLQLNATLPRLRAQFSTADVTTQVLALVTNTITNAVVMYEQYPYNSFAEYGKGVYLAAGPGGLYRVDVGDTDNGTEIAAYLSTGELMFGSEFIKRISDFYAGMRSAGDIKITVTSDEQGSYEYILSPLDIAQLKQRRSFIGKGMRGKYFNFRFDNTAGANFDFDTMNVAAVATSRRV